MVMTSQLFHVVHYLIKVLYFEQSLVLIFTINGPTAIHSTVADEQRTHFHSNPDALAP